MSTLPRNLSYLARPQFAGGVDSSRPAYSYECSITYANGRTASQYYLAADYCEMMVAMRAICANGGQVFIYTIQ